VRGVSGLAVRVASAESAFGASKALRQNAHSQGGIPSSVTQSIRAHFPGAWVLALSFRAMR
jgi:hypothetical protein